MDQEELRSFGAASSHGEAAVSDADASFDDLWPRFAETRTAEDPAVQQSQQSTSSNASTVLPNQYIERKKPLTRMCDLSAEHGICVNGGQKVLTADSVIKGTIVRMSFDDLLADRKSVV